MLSPKESTLIYETLLSSPGMNDAVKIDLRISRKAILLLSKIIEVGLSSKHDSKPGTLLEAAQGNSLEEIKSIPNLLLDKAGLTEMYQKIDALTVV